MTLMGTMTDVPPEPDTPPKWVELLQAVVDLRQRADFIEHLAVQTVREQGATWEDIGEALGISRQAARERFGTPRRRRKR